MCQLALVDASSIVPNSARNPDDLTAHVCGRPLTSDVCEGIIPTPASSQRQFDNLRRNGQ